MNKLIFEKITFLQHNELNKILKKNGLFVFHPTRFASIYEHKKYYNSLKKLILFSWIVVFCYSFEDF